MSVIKQMLVTGVAMTAAVALASEWYAAPERKGAPEDPNFCLFPETAGTLADAIGFANAGNPGDETVVLLDGVYNADWDPDGLKLTLPGVTIRSESGERGDCIVDGGGESGGRRAFRFDNGNHAYFSSISNLTFRNFHLDHSRDVSLLRKGAVLYFPSSSTHARIVNCDFLDSTCGVLGDSVAGAHLDYDSRYKDNSSGGAISAYGYVRASGCNFLRVNAAGSGAAVCMHGDGSWFEDCVFESCMSSNVTSDVSFYAGTLSCFAGTPGVASNCVFRNNCCFSGREIRGGAVLNLRTYRCRFENNGCRKESGNTYYGGDGGSIYCYATSDALVDFYTHIEDVFDDSAVAEPDPNRTRCEVNGGTLVRCRFHDMMASGGLFNGVVAYNCLFQDLAYDGYGGSMAYYNCTFARCYGRANRGTAWNGAWISSSKFINCAMLDCHTASGWLIGMNNGPYHYYDAYAVSHDPSTVNSITNSIYADDHYEGAPEYDFVGGWTGHGRNNVQYDPSNPDTVYHYIDPSSPTDPYRPARDAYMVDRGLYLEGMKDRKSPLAYDILGNPRCVGGAPDIGCYEYYVKPGISVMLR